MCVCICVYVRVCVCVCMCVCLILPRFSVFLFFFSPFHCVHTFVVFLLSEHPTLVCVCVNRNVRRARPWRWVELISPQISNATHCWMHPATRCARGSWPFFSLSHTHTLSTLSLSHTHSLSPSLFAFLSPQQPSAPIFHV